MSSLIHIMENACYQKTGKNIYNSEPGNVTTISQARSTMGAGQRLVFNLLSRETLFHEDFFHAGQMVTLKFHSISFYCAAACKL